MGSLTPFLSRVFGTEEFSCKKSFNKEFSYKDRNHPADTAVTCTNSDFSFGGPVQQLRQKYKTKADYSSGYAVLHTSVPRGDGKRGSQSKYASVEFNDHIAILDLGTFCDYFADPRVLSELLMTRTKELTASWMEKNASPEMLGKRTPLVITYNLATYPWMTQKNKREESVYTLQLSTWGYTASVQQTKHPVIGLNDVKVLIKLKSTTNATGPNTASERGPRYDGNGYGVPFLHFVGMLRSERFSTFVAEVTETMRAHSFSEEEEENDDEGYSEGGPSAKRQKTDELEEGEIA